MDPIVLPKVQLGPILPEIVMTVLVCAIILVDLFLSPRKKGFSGFLALAGLVVAGVFLAGRIGTDVKLFGGCTGWTISPPFSSSSSWAWRF